MNRENLEQIISLYEEKLPVLNGDKINERFKWSGVQHFQNVWFSEAAKEMTFAEKFAEAIKHTSIMINNSIVHPTTGIVKLAEKKPTEIEHLFNDILFAEDGGDLDVRNDHINTFLSEFEVLRQELFPSCWSYKQDRHAAICYLVCYAPDKNFIYRYSDAELFCKYIEIGTDIGAGQYFSLKKYYAMCELLVEELKKHPSMVDKHAEYLTQGYYPDKELHLLAYDLMYCAQCYKFYSGMTYMAKKKAIQQRQAGEAETQRLQERAARISELQDQIDRLTVQKEVYEAISLLNVEVTTKKYGKGIVIEQNGPKVKVQFENATASFVINRKYALRPTFENDAELVEGLSVYADLCDEIKALEGEMRAIER